VLFVISSPRNLNETECRSRKEAARQVTRTDHKPKFICLPCLSQVTAREPADVKTVVDALLATRRAESQVAECLNCNAMAFVVRRRERRPPPTTIFGHPPSRAASSTARTGLSRRTSPTPVGSGPDRCQEFPREPSSLTSAPRPPAARQAHRPARSAGSGGGPSFNHSIRPRPHALVIYDVCDDARAESRRSRQRRHRWTLKGEQRSCPARLALPTMIRYSLNTRGWCEWAA
jgi:hypothetical protein